MKKNIYQTTALVTGLSVAERALGFLYRIALSRLIGSEGLGLYQVALSVFSVFLTIGTGGVPITVSRLISKSKAANDQRGERAAVSAGIAAALFLTLPVCLLFALSGNTFAFLFSDERCLGLFKILLIGLSFSAVYAVIRGSFWGNKQFLLPSLLELVEEAAMVIAGIWLLRKASSVYDGARRATFAVIISYFISFSSATICYFARGGRLSSPKRQLKPLFSSAMPITAVRAGSSFINSAVATLLPAMLIRAGATKTEALQLFGVASGMAIPILFIPSTIIGSMSLVLVPELSEDFYRKRYARLSQNIERGIFVTLLVACTLIPIFFALGEDIGLVIYSDRLAGQMIKNCAWMLLPMSLTMISTGILNSLNFERQTLAYYFIGAAFMLTAVLLLPKYIGVYAYPLGLAASYVVCATLDLLFLAKKIPFEKKFVWRGLVQILSVFPLALLGQFAHTAIKQYLSSIPALIVTSVIILFFAFLFYVFCQFLSTKSLKKLFFRK